MSLPLWMSIEPRSDETRLMLTEPSERCLLRARLSSRPVHRRSLITFMEACSLWYGRPLHAVVDADAEDVRHDPEKWAALLAGPRSKPRSVGSSCVRAGRSRPLPAASVFTTRSCDG